MIFFQPKMYIELLAPSFCRVSFQSSFYGPINKSKDNDIDLSITPPDLPHQGGGQNCSPSPGGREPEGGGIPESFLIFVYRPVIFFVVFFLDKRIKKA